MTRLRKISRPFLGVSSLNSAAPSGAAFFLIRTRTSRSFAVDGRAAASQRCAIPLLPEDCTVKYEIDYTFIAKGAAKAEEIGTSADLVLGDEAGFGLIPNVGDYIDIPRSRMGERENYRGKVSRRLFRHVLGYCYIRIVVEEVDDATRQQMFV
jgi:hypothetical protein